MRMLAALARMFPVWHNASPKEESELIFPKLTHTMHEKPDKLINMRQVGHMRPTVELCIKFSPLALHVLESLDSE